MAFRLDGDATDATPARSAVHDDSFLVLMNGERTRRDLHGPREELGEAWRVVVDTREPPGTGEVAPRRCARSSSPPVASSCSSEI